MKNLLKFLSPFAPDQSGAEAVLYELGGLTAICDAGGCTGNICGFDEPRWLTKKSALFSAGLRDMDAILGRDDRLIKKLSDATAKLKPAFTAIIGTPVPAVIATDFRALRNMAEKKTGLPCITVECSGTKYYDCGEEKAFLEVFRTFAEKEYPIEKGRTGIIGATPLEISEKTPFNLTNALRKKGISYPVCYTMESGPDDIKKASACEKNIVISPAGIKTAEYLKEKFGTPYTVDFPFIPEKIMPQIKKAGGKVLVVHQQFIADKIRKILDSNSVTRCDCGTFFMMNSQFSLDNDVKFSDEEQFAETVRKENYDCIIGDKAFSKVLCGYKGRFIDLPHFAVSGRLWEETQ